MSDISTSSNNNIVRGIYRDPNDEREYYHGEFKNINGKLFRNGYGKCVINGGLIIFEGFYIEGRRNGKGKLNNISTGLAYSGEWVHGQLIKGKYISNDRKLLYEGEFKEDNGVIIREGIGKYIDTIEETIYEGSWVNDKSEGYGRFTITNADTKTDIYEGSFRDDVFSGKGTFNLGDGGKYIGDFEDNFMHGQGIFLYPDKSKYEGGWVQDERCGYGVYTDPVGGIYEGQFKSDKFNGRAVYKYPDASVYTGYFVDNERHGEGEYYDAKTMISYKGDWYIVFVCTLIPISSNSNNTRFKGNREGSGTETDAKSGDTYCGSFKNDLPNGFGKSNWPKSDLQYEGNFVDGEFDGCGEIWYSDGDYYFGNFKKGKRNGEGRCYDKKKDTWYEGLWKDGRIIKDYVLSDESFPESQAAKRRKR